MPADAELADFADLQPLLQRNGRPVRPDPDFDGDLEPIIAHLKQLDSDEAIGATLADKYTLTAEIGHGGMGVVYLAEQKQPVKRTVAVKLIKPGMDSRDVLARFDAERQALAVMDHPNIAKVHDAGMTASGRPFFVMEYVKGVPITQYCDEKKLTPQERLNLFIPVCNAVQHAHQKGIIHRDLKPSNVLVEVVDGKPVPKVIDFGLAKALGHKLTDKTLHTALDTRVGTLEYSAPEQAAGRSFDVDTRSDIYSLGVLLYELLTGAPPFTHEELLKIGEEEMRRVIREVEPTKPSKKLSSSGELPAIAAKRHLEPNKLTRMVQGDLDWIVMKCLEKENARRYETANQLGQELQRFLADEPVQARPPSATYRAKKFLRRNKGLVIAAALVFLTLVVGVIGTGIGLVQAEQARKAEAKQGELTAAALVKSEENRMLADQGYAAAHGSINDFLSDVGRTHVQSLPGMRSFRKDLAEQAVRKLRVLSAGRPDDDSLRVELARAHLHLGVLAGRLGNIEEAEQAFRAAETIQEPLAKKNPDQVEYRNALAEIGLELSEMYFWNDKPDLATDLAEKALAIAQKVVAIDPEQKPYRVVLARLYHRAGFAARKSGPAGRKREQEHYQQALKIWEELLKQDPGNAPYHFYAARTLLNLAHVLKAAGDLEQAARTFSEAEESLKKAISKEPDNAEYRYIFTLVLMGKMRTPNPAHPNEWWFVFLQVGKELRSLISLDPTEMKYLSWYASTQQELAAIWSGAENFEEAASCYEAAAAALEKIAERKDRELEPLWILMGGYEKIAGAEEFRGRSDSAASWYQKSLDTCVKALRQHPGDPDLPLVQARYHKSRANVLEAGDPSAALKDYQAALRVWDSQVLTARDFSVREFLVDEYLTLCTDAAQFAAQARELDVADEFFQRAEKLVREGKSRKDQHRLATVLVGRGHVALSARKEPKDAAHFYQRAIDMVSPLSEQALWHTYLTVTLCEAHAGLAKACAESNDVAGQVGASRQYLRLISQLDGKDRAASVPANSSPTPEEAKRLSGLIDEAKLPATVWFQCKQHWTARRSVYIVLPRSGDDPLEDQARALREDHKLDLPENVRERVRVLCAKSREQRSDFLHDCEKVFKVSRRSPRQEPASRSVVEVQAQLEEMLKQVEQAPAELSKQKALAEKLADPYTLGRLRPSPEKTVLLYERWQKACERGLAGTPGLTRLRYYLGQAFSGLARCSGTLQKPQTGAYFDAAARHLADLLKQQPKDDEVCAALGEVFLERGRWQVADRKTEEALGWFVRAQVLYRAASDLAPDNFRYKKLAFRVLDWELFQAVKRADDRVARLGQPSEIPLHLSERSADGKGSNDVTALTRPLSQPKKDDKKRTIVLLYGKMDNGKPCWVFAAVKPSKYKEFMADQKAGGLDLERFNADYGELVISGEGAGPPEDVSRKVAEMYQTDPKAFLENVKSDMKEKHPKEEPIKKKP